MSTRETVLFSENDKQQQYELEQAADRLLVEAGASADREAPCRTSSTNQRRDRIRKTGSIDQITYHLPASVPLYYLEELVARALKCKARKIEAEIHALSECGYTNLKISKMLKLHRHTIAKHLRSAQNKVRTHISQDEGWYIVYMNEVGRHDFSGTSSFDFVAPEIREAREIIEEAADIETFINQEELIEGQLYIRLTYPNGDKYRLTERQLVVLAFTGSVRLSAAQGGGILDYFGRTGE